VALSTTDWYCRDIGATWRGHRIKADAVKTYQAGLCFSHPCPKCASWGPKILLSQRKWRKVSVSGSKQWGGVEHSTQVMRRVAAGKTEKFWPSTRWLALSMWEIDSKDPSGFREIRAASREKRLSWRSSFLGFTVGKTIMTWPLIAECLYALFVARLDRKRGSGGNASRRFKLGESLTLLRRPVSLASSSNCPSGLLRFSDITRYCPLHVLVSPHSVCTVCLLREPGGRG